MRLEVWKFDVTVSLKARSTTRCSLLRLKNDTLFFESNCQSRPTAGRKCRTSTALASLPSPIYLRRHFFAHDFVRLSGRASQTSSLRNHFQTFPASAALVVRSSPVRSQSAGEMSQPKGRCRIISRTEASARCLLDAPGWGDRCLQPSYDSLDCRCD